MSKAALSGCSKGGSAGGQSLVLDRESAPSHNRDEVVAPFGIVFEDFRFAAVCVLGPSQWFAWLEGVVQHEPEIFVRRGRNHPAFVDTVVRRHGVPEPLRA